MKQKKQYSAQEEIKVLTDKINHYDHLYYNLDNPGVSDAEYDALRKKLKELEDRYPKYILPYSPRFRVGIAPISEFKKIQHNIPMLSLDNVFNKAELEDYIKKTKKFLNLSKTIEFVGEPKIDGLSVSLIYEDGILIQAITRGDGKTGEDITVNAKTIKDIPLSIGEKKSVEIRGEIYIEKKAFEDLNKERSKNGKPLFANPRNSAAGSVRQLDSRAVAKRPLRFFAYYLNMEVEASQWEQLEILKNWGFFVCSESQICSQEDDLQKYYEKMEAIRSDLPYDIDGIVFKVNNHKLCTRLGVVGRSPRYAVAYKFPAQTAQTTLEDIIIQVGRNGTLTPVAILKPVNIGGVMVKRASLHNKDEIGRKDIRVGDTVIVKRAGDVIPQIVEVVKDLRKQSVQFFKFPEKCPVCGTEVHYSQASIFCPNIYGCCAQIKEKIEHFVSRDAFNIDGLGKSSVAFLYNKGYIKSVVDIFTLKERSIDLLNEPGWGKLSQNNLYKAIDSKRKISLSKFIYALGIPMVGVVTADLLAQHYKTVETFMRGSSADLSDISGIGPVVETEVNYFLEHNQGMLEQLMQQIYVEPYQSQSAGKLSGQTVVFTGTLSISRAEAKLQAQSIGACVGSSITKKTDMVVAGDNPGSKLKKAYDLGISVLSETEWANLLTSE